jgi:inosine/xanthosine triphosphatase
MIIHVGSKNKTKIQAVKDALKLYPNLFSAPEIIGVSVSVEEFGHPKNIEETITGAIERAKKAFRNCDYSFGLEGGLMEIPYSRSGVMEVGACAIYDGKEIYLGLSPAYEWPTEVTKLILSGKSDASKAFKELGYTEHEKLGAVEGGAIGFLTEGRLTREDFTKYSIIMALVQIEKSHLYTT